MIRLPILVRVGVLPAMLAVALVGAPAAAAAGPASVAPEATRTVAGTGVLAARGSGYARLAGSYALTGALDGGWIRVSGLDRGSRVRVTGWTSRTRFADGSLLFRFRGTAGHFAIAGRTIVTAIGSPQMRFVASGHGRVLLKGRGSVWVNGHGPRPWSPAGTARTF
jgi:hypothetical protein